VPHSTVSGNPGPTQNCTSLSTIGSLQFAAGDWAQAWQAVRNVPDGQGGGIRVPGRPCHFDEQVAADDVQFAARQGEHNTPLLAELGFGRDDIARLEASGALVEPSRGWVDSEAVVVVADPVQEPVEAH
jgi:hypothetical protein